MKACSAFSSPLMTCSLILSRHKHELSLLVDMAIARAYLKCPLPISGGIFS
jgi:hypothetical protein